MQTVKSKRPPLDISGRLALRVSEVGRLIGVSSATVRNMIADGKLPARRVGSGRTSKSFVVPVDALKAWLSGQT